jgi:RNA recognition motif-containing protein
MKSLLRLIAIAFAAAMLFAGPALAGNTKLFVSNLPFATSSADLRNAFSAYGTVQDASIMTDKVTGKPRGFAYVTMSDSSEAEAAITGLNGKDFNGRILEVKTAVSREESPPRAGHTPRKAPDRQRW